MQFLVAMSSVEFYLLYRFVSKGPDVLSEPDEGGGSRELSAAAPTEETE